jgi:predicted nucleic acid-binding protein
LGAFAARHLTHRLGILDALIAACAQEQGVPLYTFNRKHFRSVDGLVIEQPYAR